MEIGIFEQKLLFNTVCQAFDTTKLLPFSMSKWQTTNCQCSGNCRKMLFQAEPHFSLLALQFPAYAKLETVIISP